MRSTNGNYDAAGWTSRRECLKACTAFHGANYQSLYSLSLEHIGTEGADSDVVNCFERSRDGCAYYQALDDHFCNKVYLENVASAAEQKFSTAAYRGDRRTFTIESYYSTFSECFNHLDHAGPAH